MIKLNDIVKENRLNFHPHCDNINAKIKKGKKAFIQFKENTYNLFVQEISKIDFDSQNYYEYEKACNLIDKYYAELSDFIKEQNIDTRSGIRSSFIEELSKYLFINHSVVVKENLLFKNSKICTGLYFSKESLKTTEKNVDFCICEEKNIKFGNSSFKIVIPIVCVECKTFLDGTMFNEVADTSNMIHTINPGAYNFVFMLWNAVGKNKFTVLRKSTNINQFFSLMNRPNSKEKEKNIKIDPHVLMSFYNSVSEALVEYFSDYEMPDHGVYL